MQKYTIFWVEEEFCYHYYYKSEILYRFLNEYMSNFYRKDLRTQFNYITRIIPYSSLITHIQTFHHNQIKFKIDGRNIELNKGEHNALLYLNERSLSIMCPSIQDAEIILFQALTSFDRNFFIIEQDTTNSGWISPVKKEVLL